MISFRAFLGVCLLLLSVSSQASDYLCPVPSKFQKLACVGSVRVRNLKELIAYKGNLAQIKGRAQNLIIDFDVRTSALSLSTPCSITLSERRSFLVNGDLCLHADNGVQFLESTHLNARNVRLESSRSVMIENHAEMRANNVELFSFGKGEDSKAYIRDGARVYAQNLMLMAYDRVGLGGHSNYSVLGDLRLYSKGDDDTSVGINTKITAGTFELQAFDQAIISPNVAINAKTVIINGKSCSISNKTTLVSAKEKIGNCFPRPSPKPQFSVNVTSGYAPLRVIFDARKIKGRMYFWSFGNGYSYLTKAPMISYNYTRPGIYTASLRYLENSKGPFFNPNKWISAGSIVNRRPTTQN